MDTWDHHKQELRELLANEYRVSLMNTTKWEEVKDLIQRLELGYRVKLITSEKPADWQNGNFWVPRGFLDFFGQPIHILRVEWMEIESLYWVPRPYVGPDRYEDRSL